MTLLTMELYSDLAAYMDSLLSETSEIPDHRKRLLGSLSDYIADRSTQNLPVRLTFICTHNSRRSHISQIWATTAAARYELAGVQCYSGGTEATAFNPRAAAALGRAGFRIENPGGPNPHYLVSFAGDVPPIECFSKVYDHPSNPKSDFAAVMTCAEADENCPYIPGAIRIALTYEDPKVADDTAEETARYDERVRQIGREMVYVMKMARAARASLGTG